MHTMQTGSEGAPVSPLPSPGLSRVLGTAVGQAGQAGPPGQQRLCERGRPACVCCEPASVCARSPPTPGRGRPKGQRCWTPSTTLPRVSDAVAFVSRAQLPYLQLVSMLSWSAASLRFFREQPSQSTVCRSSTRLREVLG